MEDPYSAEGMAKIKQFYYKRMKDPFNYKYTENGDLISNNTVLKLKSYVPLTEEDRENMEKERRDLLIAIETEIETKKRELRYALEEYKESGDVGQVLLKNKEVEALEQQRVSIRTQERFIKMIQNPATNQILLDKPRETRKLIAPGADPFDFGVFALVTREFRPRDFYGKYVDSESVKNTGIDKIGLDATRTYMKDGKIARFFYEASDVDPNSPLSPLLSAKIIIESTEYSNAIQAYEAERAKELGLNDIVGKLMKTRSARTVRLIMKEVKDQVENPEEVWLGVLSAMFLQNSDLQDFLLSTGDDILAYADPTSALYGIGVGIEDAKRLDQKQWKGQNIVGRMMERVRVQLREETSEKPIEKARVAVISREEQDAARKAAIMRARKR